MAQHQCRNAAKIVLMLLAELQNTFFDATAFTEEDFGVSITSQKISNGDPFRSLHTVFISLHDFIEDPKLGAESSTILGSDVLSDPPVNKLADTRRRELSGFGLGSLDGNPDPIF